MLSDTKKTGLMKNTSSKTQLIGEGILMYSERLDLREETIGEIAAGGYVISFGDRSFVLTIHRGK